ncbi:CBS domain-containing protein [Desulfonema magnum]|uniref:CBS domain-containing protein n=1 Tax=Desulfonema magnum TaxID=45655 RepID=A0A975BMI4_9BACT|nr:CBS domain-containing protein [Desulfonema magnum]QTA87992.1 CBS domain-containing protein [Desulfonema magnum]
MKLEEFMTTKIKFVDADQSLYDAIEKMVDRRIRSLIVKFPGDTANYGVITARDIVFGVLAKGINPKDIKVSEIASKPIMCIDRNTKIYDASKLMEQSDIARVFVCEGDNIIGVVSLIDIMDASLIMRARGKHVS